MSLRYRKFLHGAAIVVLATALAAGLARTSWLQAMENLYFDGWHILAGVRYVPRHTALVTIDDASLLALKDDPFVFWAPHFGRAMDVLANAGAKVIGLDFLYQVSAESWLRKLNLPDSDISRNFDSPLRAALARGDKILVERTGGGN